MRKKTRVSSPFFFPPLQTASILTSLISSLVSPKLGPIYPPSLAYFTFWCKLLDAWIVGSFAVRFPSFPFFIPLFACALLGFGLDIQQQNHTSFSCCCWISRPQWRICCVSDSSVLIVFGFGFVLFVWKLLKPAGSPVRVSSFVLSVSSFLLCFCSLLRIDSSLVCWRIFFWLIARCFWFKRENEIAIFVFGWGFVWFLEDDREFFLELFCFLQQDASTRDTSRAQVAEHLHTEACGVRRFGRRWR